ncbi:MAG: hypothetical protein JJU24_15895, partial [Natronohydrobacter sp.]|nr:hypothetical protein [Natronohydrobacter sp.]
MREKPAKARKAKVAPTGLVTRAVDLTRREGLGYSARVAASSIQNMLLIRAEAGRAALRGEPAQAAWIWRYRPVAPAHVTPVDMYRDLVESLLARGQLEQANSVIRRLRARFPQSGAFRKLHARLAIENGNWLDALLRWQEVAPTQPDGAAPLPAEWVYRIGVARARAQTDALAPGPTRALGYLSLAAVLRSGDEVLALTLARGAREFYREQVLELLVRILSANTRYTAAIWWARRLIETAETPRRHMAQLFEALIASSRLDDCEQALAGYLDAYGRDTLWLRVRVECSYRRSDFGAMQAVMQEAMETGVARSHGSVRVMDWLYKLIRLDPEPHMFLPPEIRDLAMNLASRYDTASIAGALRDLLAPDRAERIAQRHAAQIRDA